MTAAEESVRRGDLREALLDLQAQVKKQPADPRLRVFLFQLLSVMGQWDRAATQLDVAGDLDPSTLEMVRAYKAVIPCERLRASVFGGRTTPAFFGEPASWMAILVQALQETARGRFVEARALRDRAFEEAPATAGSIVVAQGRAPEAPAADASAADAPAAEAPAASDQTFSWIADADPRMGPVLEAIVNGKYYWIPFARIRELAIEPPVDLRDIAWTPARLTFSNGGETVAFIPTRYPGSEAAADTAIVTGRTTVWTDGGSETFLGLGQRVFATDGGDHALMDVRRLRLDAAIA